MKRTILLCLSFLIGCQAVVTTAPIRLLSDEPVIVNLHPYAGVLYRNLLPICTLELVDARTFVTAAHCTPDGPELAFYTASFGDDPERFFVTGFIAHEGWDPTSWTGHDIAVGYLATAPDVAPIPIRREPISVGNFNDQVTVVGRSGGDYRATDRWILGKLEGTDLVLWADPDGFLIPGDSGGPMILNGELAGVNVLMIWEEGDGPCAWSTSASTDVGAHAGWIDEHREPDPGRLPELPVPGLD